MKNYILAILALFTLSACSADSTKQDLANTWDNITGFGSDDALKEYTSLIQKHSTERWANYSDKAVNLCHIEKGGMTVTDLTSLIKENHKDAKECWNALVDYPSSDVRFFKDGTIEKEILTEFNENKEKYLKLFETK